MALDARATLLSVRLCSRRCRRRSRCRGPAARVSARNPYYHSNQPRSKRIEIPVNANLFDAAATPDTSSIRVASDSRSPKCGGGWRRGGTPIRSDTHTTDFHARISGQRESRMNFLLSPSTVNPCDVERQFGYCIWNVELCWPSWIPLLFVEFFNTLKKYSIF